MKKILLGTTALVSAGLLAQQAQADASVSVSGSATVGMYVAGGSSDKDQTGLEFKQDAGVTFNGSTTLDNGLDVGFSLGTETGKETVINVEGGFGKIALGLAHSAAKVGQKSGPWVNSFFSANSGTVSQTDVNSSLVNATTSLGDVAGETNSMMYFSPAFSGFSFSVSYTPDSKGAAAPNNDSPKDPSVGGALGYSGDASMGIGVDAGAGWVRRTNPDSDATTGTNFGITVSMEGASIGSGYSTIVTGNDKRRSYDVAFRYSLGNGVTAGLGWIHHNNQGNDDAGRGNGYRVQAAYDLGPGVTVNAALGADNYTKTGQPKEDGTLVGLALAASF